MLFRSSTLAFLALVGMTACNVDNDADGIAAHLDCDDNNPDIGPGAAELCDGLDNDCNGIVDDDPTDAPTFYADFDGDGFGDPDSTTTDCQFSEAAGGPDPEFQPFGFVVDNTDCDDALSSVNTDADERCDGIDNDCDKEVDEDDAVDKAVWYADSDADGFGNEADPLEACDQPDDYVADNTDCDDTTDVSNPAADEICDGADNDCDEEVDEDDAVDADSWYADTDEDTYGDPGNAVQSCSQPDGYVADMTDCNDEAETARPGGTEVCDGLDNDCDEATLEDGTVSLNATDVAYTTIQEAVDAAVEGDTVFVCAGEWFENVGISEAITLKGATGADNVILNGGEEDSVIEIDAESTTASVVLEGLTITGGSGFAGGVDASGSAVTIDIADCVIEGNEGLIGGVFGGFDEPLNITDSVIQDNDAEVAGGIYAGELTLTDSRVLNNTAADVGGGIITFGAAEFVSSVVISNFAENGGGGAYQIDDGSITGGEFRNNQTSGEGGGIYADVVDLTDVVVSGNRAGLRGGGVFGFDMTLDNAEIDSNTAPEGGGVYLLAEVIMVDTDITNNTATDTGGGVYQLFGDVLMENCSVEGNTADAGGGWHLVEGTLDVTTSDWGTSADGNDNTPDDVYSDESATAYTAFGAGVSFVCDEDGDCI